MPILYMSETIFPRPKFKEIFTHILKSNPPDLSIEGNLKCVKRCDQEITHINSDTLFFGV